MHRAELLDDVIADTPLGYQFSGQRYQNESHRTLLIGDSFRLNAVNVRDVEHAFRDVLGPDKHFDRVIVYSPKGPDGRPASCRQYDVSGSQIPRFHEPSAKQLFENYGIADDHLYSVKLPRVMEDKQQIAMNTSGLAKDRLTPEEAEREYGGFKAPESSPTQDNPLAKESFSPGLGPQGRIIKKGSEGPDGPEPTYVERRREQPLQVHAPDPNAPILDPSKDRQPPRQPIEEREPEKPQQDQQPNTTPRLKHKL